METERCLQQKARRYIQRYSTSLSLCIKIDLRILLDTKTPTPVDAFLLVSVSAPAILLLLLSPRVSTLQLCTKRSLLGVLSLEDGQKERPERDDEEEEDRFESTSKHYPHSKKEET